MKLGCSDENIKTEVPQGPVISPSITEEEEVINSTCMFGFYVVKRLFRNDFTNLKNFGCIVFSKKPRSSHLTIVEIDLVVHR